MKRIISALLVLAMLLAVIPFASVSAATVPTYSADAYNALVKAMLEYGEGKSSYTTDSEYPGIYIGEKIDLSSYSVTEEQASALMQDVLDNEPMLFYMDYQYFTWPSRTPGLVDAIEPIYVMTDTEAVSATKYVNEEIEAILATLPEGLDEYETALYFYEYLALNFDYDHDYEIYDIYNMLQNGIGVCQGYSLLYDELLTRSGIANSAAVSMDLVHMWNEIKVGGKWYQVDVTWGDYEDPFNQINYSYFLMSNSRSSSLHENATDIAVKYDCTDTTFDKISWKGYATQFAFANGKTYCMDDDGEYIQEINLLTGAKENVLYIGRENNEYYMDQVWETYSHVGSYDDRLIYNSGDDIMFYDPAADELGLLYTASEGDILQMIVFDGIVTYSPSNEIYNDEIYYYIIDFSKASSAEKPVAPTDPPVDPPVDPTVLYGDVTKDGVVNKEDYLAIKRYCFGTMDLDEEALELADVDHDSEVGKSDYTLVKRSCFGTYVIS